MAAQLVRLSPVTPLTKIEGTSTPRFYTDGANKPLADELLISIARGKICFVINAVERLLSPPGYNPIKAMHDGEPVGRKLLIFLGNSPHELC